MNTSDALDFFQRNKIDSLIYSIGTPKQTQCYVIEEEKGIWITYHWERGARHFIKFHSNEAAAVSDLISNVAEIAWLNNHRKIIMP